MKSIWEDVMRFLLISIFLILAVSANAQDCNKLLEGGIYDTDDRQDETKISSSFSNWFCDKKYSSEAEFEKWGASLTVPIYGVPVKLGFDKDKQTWSNWQSEFCSQTKTNSSQHTKNSHVIRTINKNLLQSFDKCIGAVGLHTWLVYTYDPKVFHFNNKFTSPGARYPSAQINEFAPSSNVSCERKPGVVDGSGWETRCIRSNDAAIDIIINADWPHEGGTSLSLPEIVKYKELPQIPHGCSAIDSSGKCVKCEMSFSQISKDESPKIKYLECSAMPENSNISIIVKEGRFNLIGSTSIVGCYMTIRFFGDNNEVISEKNYEGCKEKFDFEGYQQTSSSGKGIAGIGITRCDLTGLLDRAD